MAWVRAPAAIESRAVYHPGRDRYGSAEPMGIEVLGMGKIGSIHHVSLMVADTERSLSFYRDLLGLAVEPDRPDLGYPGAWLRVGDMQIHLLELPNPDPVRGRPAHGGRDRHLALLVDDIDWLAGRLEAAGIALTRSRSGRRAVFCRDPDANALEFVEASRQAGPAAQNPR
jgi:glyoxylase I family protein